MDKLKVSVVGTGYVGLVTAVTLAEKGHPTVCIDIDKGPVEAIMAKKAPFFEKGLDELVEKNVESGMLKATMDSSVIPETDVTLICVGTPSLPNGSSNLKYIKEASATVGWLLRDKKDYHLVGVKSTVPPGTTEGLVLSSLKKGSRKRPGKDLGLVMIPEFLRQGQAVHDSFHPSRIIIGEYDKNAGEQMEALFSDFVSETGEPVPVLHTAIKSAELTKYASNAFLATKISFANEFARVCERFNIDVYEVMKGVGMDFRINPNFLNAGCGFGGSCFPKDVKAITTMAAGMDVETPLMDAVLETNELQPLHLVEIIRDAVGDLEDKVVAVLGLSFKPDTDDTRETRALPIIQELCDEGASVRAYDPQAMEKFRKMTDLPIYYAKSIRDALSGSHLAVIQSDWQEIRDISPETFKELLRKPMVVDGRRSFDPETLKKAGVTYRSVGWKNRK